MVSVNRSNPVRGPKHPASIALAAAIAGLVGGTATAAGEAPFQPGMWEVTTKAQIRPSPDTPPMVARMLAAQLARPQVRSHCVTAADLAVSPGSILAISGGICRYTKSIFSGGKMTLQTECTGANGEHTVTDMTGSYTPTSFSATGSKTRAGQPGPAMTIVASGRRTGATCAGG